MKRVLGFAAVAALFLSAGFARAQDAYTIKIKDLGEGDVHEVQKVETVDASTVVSDATGKALANEKHKTVTTSAYKETILKCEAKKSPTKVERVYDKATESTDGKSVTLPYQGKTVVIEKQKDGKFHFSVDGKDLNDADAGPLVKEFAKANDSKEELEKALLPKKPVKVNDTWDVDMKTFLKDMTKGGEMDVDTDKAKGTATLLKAYKKDDKQFGVLKLTLTMPVKSVGAAKEQIVSDGKSVATVDMELDVCIDGTSGTGSVKGGMKLDLKGSLQNPQVGKLAVVIGVTSKSEESSKELPKK